MSLGNTGLNKCDQECSICWQALRVLNLWFRSSYGGCMPCIPDVWLWNSHGAEVTGAESAQTSPISPHPQPLVTTTLLSVTISLTFLESTYKWDNAMFAFCVLTLLGIMISRFIHASQMAGFPCFKAEWYSTVYVYVCVCVYIYIYIYICIWLDLSRGRREKWVDF